LRIAIISYKYPISLSPTIKSIISYFTDRSIVVDIFVDQMSNGFVSDNTNFISLIPILILKFIKKMESKFGKYTICGRSVDRYIFRIYQILESKFVFYKISSKLNKNKYVYIFCIEAHSLKKLSQQKNILQSTIYVSLELAAIISEYDKKEVAIALSKCKACLIQSEERGKDLLQYLETKIKIEYLPVSLRPRISEEAIKCREKTKIIYSGYFAEWACLREFLNEYIKIERNDILLRLQGHSEGTQAFLEELRLVSENSEKIEFDFRYYSDEKHFKMLSTNDIGLALYKKQINDTNWENIIFSSGKIATYLWAGLPIITNIDEEITRKPPFLYISEITAAKLDESISKYNMDRKVYTRSALQLAENYYNFDKYMDIIAKNLLIFNK